MKTFEDLEFKQHPIHKEGLISRCHFENGFGASVACHDFSYGGREGLYELAVLFDNQIHYDNPVANGDVCGYLTENEVTQLLIRIQQL